MSDLPSAKSSSAFTGVMADQAHSPNRAILKTIHPASNSPSVSHAIEELSVSVRKVAVETHQPGIAALWKSTQFIDLDNMSEVEKRHLLDVLREGVKKERGKSMTDDKLLAAVRTIDMAMALQGSNIIAYKSLQIEANAKDPATILAHEFGHRAIENGYFPMIPQDSSEEWGADHVAVLLTSPKRYVAFLKEAANKIPKTNRIKTAEEVADTPKKQFHGSDYFRAQLIQNRFPHAGIDLSDFPKPTTQITVSADTTGMFSPSALLRQWIEHMSSP